MRPTMTSPPPVEEQLVLELELRILGAEQVDVFPSSRRGGLALPLDKDLMHPTSQPEAHGTFWFWGNSAMMQRW